jgi:hypothetical protein
MIFAGVDPGLHGAICQQICPDYVLERTRLGPDGIHQPGIILENHLVPMPISHYGKRPEYDLYEIERCLRNLVGLGLQTLYVERPQPLPPAMGGSLANFHRGASLKLWEVLCHCLRIPVEFVPPQTWQREMLAGCSGSDSKARALQAAQRLFPGLDLRRTPKCKKADEGFVDALLIAEFGRRKMAKSGV